MACFLTNYFSPNFYHLPATAAPVQASPTSSEPSLEGIPLICRLKIASTTPNSVLKVLELTRISEKYIEIGQEHQALQVLAQTFPVVKAVRANETPYQLAKTGETVHIVDGFMPQIVNQFAKLGQFDQARQVANSITAKTYRSDAIAFIAGAYAKAGDQRKAHETATQALQVAGKDNRDITLSRLVSLFTSANQIEPALLYSQQIENGYFRVDALTQIAIFYLKTREPVKAEATLAEALNIARTIAPASEQAPALANIAIQYAKAGQFDRTLQIAQAKETSSYRDYALIEIARAYAEERQYREAVNLAAGLADPYAKSRVLIAIATSYNNHQQPQKAAAFLSQAEQVAKTADKSIYRILAFSEITGKYAELGQYDQALKAAAAIEDESERNSWLDRLHCAISQSATAPLIQKNLLKNAGF